MSWTWDVWPKELAETYAYIFWLVLKIIRESASEMFCIFMCVCSIRLYIYLYKGRSWHQSFFIYQVERKVIFFVIFLFSVLNIDNLPQIVKRGNKNRLLQFTKQTNLKIERNELYKMKFKGKKMFKYAFTIIHQK